MKRNRLQVVMFCVIAVAFTACGMKDADIKNSIEMGLNATREVTGITVNVENGVAFIEGQCKDDNCKSRLELIAQRVEGVKTVISNLTVAAIPAPVMTADLTKMNDPLIASVDSVAAMFPRIKAVVSDSSLAVAGTDNRQALQKNLKKSGILSRSGRARR